MKKQVLFLQIFFILISLNSEIRRVAIYGDDDRLNYYEADEISKILSHSVGVLIRNRDIVPVDGNRYVFRTRTLAERFNIASNQRFADEPSVGFCSGFLASSQTFITASHCLDEVGCSNFSVVFDYKIEQSKLYPTYLNGSYVYRCSSVIYKGRKDIDDFAVIMLDRNVDTSFRYPLAIERDFEQITIGQKVFVIGYPSGIPVKITSFGSAQIRSISSTTFLTDLDTFRGNSGSPVFDENTLKVIGIVIEGEKDYAYSNGSREIYDPSYPQVYESGRYNIIDQNGGSGELILKSKVFTRFVPENRLERFINSNPGVLKRNSSLINPAIYNPDEIRIQVRPAIYEIPQTPKNPAALFI